MNGAIDNMFAKNVTSLVLRSSIVPNAVTRRDGDKGGGSYAAHIDVSQLERRHNIARRHVAIVEEAVKNDGAFMPLHGHTLLMQTAKNTRYGTSLDLSPDLSMSRLVTLLRRQHA